VLRTAGLCYRHAANCLAQTRAAGVRAVHCGSVDLHTNVDPTSAQVSWADTRAALCESFGGELPEHATEATIVEVFERFPLGVLRLAEEIATAKSAGKIRSGWAVLRSRLPAAEPIANPVVSIATRRAERIRVIEQYIANAGHTIDRESELLDDLYGERGRLREYRDDDTLRERLLELWRKTQPARHQLEREANEREANYRRLDPLRRRAPRAEAV